MSGPTHQSSKPVAPIDAHATLPQGFRFGDLGIRTWANPFDFSRWRDAPLTSAQAERDGRHARASIVVSEGHRNSDGRNEQYLHYRDKLLSYQIYPSEKIRGFIDSPDGKIKEGCLVGQRLFMNGVCIDCAVKVTKVFDEAGSNVRRTGFTYETLKGHPEQGKITFTLEQNLQTGKMTFQIESYSRPGNVLSRLLTPISLAIQRGLNESALENFARKG